VRRLLTAPLAALAVLSAAPAGASASASLEVGIADDGVLLQRPFDKAVPIVARWQRLGVQSVRIHARWISIAPASNATVQPSGFHPRDPNDPRYNWAALDRAVALVSYFGMKPMLAVTGSGPVWSSQKPSLHNPRYRPDPRKFGDFATAVALRYRRAVDRYLVWNEPNQPGWLQPQFDCPRGPRSCTPAAPHIYRNLVNAAEPAIRTADPGAQVLIGTLAPRGSDPVLRNKPMRPLPFIRAMGCVDDRYVRIRTGPCAGFRAPRADGFSYHPHGVLRAPDEHDPNVDQAAMADLSRVEQVLDKVAARGGLQTRGAVRMPLFLTEFGYQTNPPDPFSGVSPARQATWIQQAAYVAWRDPRVKTLVQYGWRDDEILDKGLGRKAYAGWQSGLVDERDRPKPALTAFPHPFWIDTVRLVDGRPRFWGQVRPGGSTSVVVERRMPGSSAWTAVKQLRTDALGYFTTTSLAVPPRADYRFTYTVAGATARARPVAVHSSVFALRAPL
jgi:hypothetical protein